MESVGRLICRAGNFRCVRTYRNVKLNNRSLREETTEGKILPSVKREDFSPLVHEDQRSLLDGVEEEKKEEKRRLCTEKGWLQEGK